jgi:very-short-patch-repair endonuclease
MDRASGFEPAGWRFESSRALFLFRPGALIPASVEAYDPFSQREKGSHELFIIIMRMNYRKREFARILRSSQTPCEEKVWELLRGRKFMGLKFRRQHVIEGFVVDFYCHEYKFGIEIDGGVHAKQKDYDELRQEIIESESINLIRIKNSEIEKDEKIVLMKIQEYINNLNR